MSTIDVLCPVSPVLPAPRLELAPRKAPPAGGAHLALISNGKPRARELLEYLAEELSADLPIAGVELHVKPTAAFPLDPEAARDLATRADLAIAALGDCGACSACSLHDAVQMERLGVPATLLITDVFPRTVASFSRTLGAEGYHHIVLPHPVSSRSAERLRTLARGAAGAAREQLTAPLTAPALNA